MEMISDVLYQRRCETIARSRDLKESAEMHRKIYRAIRAGNGEAARAAMSEHLILAERALAEEEGSAKPLDEPSSERAKEPNNKHKAAGPKRSL